LLCLLRRSIPQASAFRPDLAVLIFPKGNDERTAADLAVVIDFGRKLSSPRERDFEGLETTRTSDLPELHPKRILRKP
jgi:hypothetical protein